jgi:YYY domain-containing protein
MFQDLLIVVIWWATVFAIGAAAWPLTRKLFASWWDCGYSFSKAVGLAGVTGIAWYLGSFKVLPFTRATIVLAIGLLFAIGIALPLAKSLANRKIKGFNDVFLKSLHSFKTVGIRRIVILEIFFFLSLLLWSFVKAHEPDIRGLEKFMDYGFAKTITNTAYFPPPDMWYAGGSVNYYYFGHTVMAMLSIVSGVDLAYGYNITLAMIFALCLTMSFSIGVELYRKKILSREGKAAKISRFWMLVSGSLSGWLVTLSGNMQTIYAFTKGYNTENAPPPFWQVFGSLQEYGTTLSQGLQTYWYANATRFIPFTIHEFPSYSFVVSDNHGHVLSIPFVLLAIALLVNFFGKRDEHHEFVHNTSLWIKKIQRFAGVHALFYGLYGVLVGILLMTNALDGPIYFGLFIVLLLFQGSKHRVLSLEWIKEKVQAVGVVGSGLVLVTLPFLLNFTSFANGIAVNCPPSVLENTKIGPIIFETIDKCQKSPLWMMWLLWGFFWFSGVTLILHIVQIQFQKRKRVFESFAIHFSLNPITKTLLILFFYSLGLIIFAEFFYFKDIYPAHFRSNTMFKLGYQAFILCSLISAYVIVDMVRKKRFNTKLKKGGCALFFICLVPQLFLVSIFPFFSVRSYFGSLQEYKGLYGLQWFARDYPDDYKAMLFLADAAQNNRSFLRRENRIGTNFLAVLAGKDVHVKNWFFTAHFPLTQNILEADGDSYTDYERISAFSGIPTIVGWGVHEWLWRGSYDVVSPRKEEVRLVYEGEDDALRFSILNRYNIRYIVVGSLERKLFTKLQEEKIKSQASVVFLSGETVIYDREVLTNR